MRDTPISSTILYFPDALPSSSLFLAALETFDDWSEWLSDGNPPFSYGTVKVFSQISGDKSPEFKYIVNSIKKINYTCGLRYLSHINAPQSEMGQLRRTVLTDKVPFAVKKYHKNGTPLGPHPDIPTESMESSFSITLYPNDSYEGGELSFPETGIRLKPKAGSVVVYPSRYIHESLPPKQGEKLVSNYVYTARENLWI